MPVPLETTHRRDDQVSPGTIGLSGQNRPIPVIYRGRSKSPLRVLIMGGQHGDERLARRAVENFGRMQRQANAASKVRLALVPSINPDGADQRVRRNAAGIDLNRDHLQLDSVECRALHQFVRRWQPHLIVDVHTYPPRRRHLLARGLVYGHDVFLDLPTNPSLRLPLSPQQLTQGIASITAALNDRGFLAARYTIVRRSGRVRHSTPDIVDARNQFALRYGIPTLLVEGRQPRRVAQVADTTDQVLAALETALQLIVDWAVANAAGLQQPLRLPRPSDLVAVGCRYVRAPAPANMVFRDAVSGQLRETTMEGVFTPDVRVTDRISLPRAYLVPSSLDAVIATLARHGFRFQQCPAADHVAASGYHIARAISSPRANRASRGVRCERFGCQRLIGDYVEFPATQPGGDALAVLLEPTSKYGLARIDSMRLPVRPGSRYPILRCEAAAEIV